MKKMYFYDSVIGKYALQQEGEALTRLWLGDRLTLLPRETETRETPLLQEAHKQLQAYFAGKRQHFSLPLHPQGTAFQLKVWEALQTIPYGDTLTYGQLAERIGKGQAARAVGMANSRNPLPIFIPCHRVIGVGGRLVGYTGGMTIKEKLLDIEKKNRQKLGIWIEQDLRP